jgi:hypothetical protein
VLINVSIVIQIKRERLVSETSRSSDLAQDCGFRIYTSNSS